MAKNKLSAGAVVACIAAVLAVAGLIAYLINAGTAYYAKYGVDTIVVVCLAASAALSLVRLFYGKNGKPAWTDLLPVCASVLAAVGFMLLLNARINSLAAVFTFENNAANMADTTSCIVAIAGAALAMILSVVSAFSDTAKEA